VTYLNIIALSLATMPGNWQVSDITDNATGRRHIFGESSGWEEATSPKSATLKVSCSNELPFRTMIWVESEAKFSANVVVVDFLPNMVDLKTQDVDRLIKLSRFTFSRYSSTLSPDDSELLDRHISENSEKGNFRVNIYRDGGEDHINFDFSGYNTLKQYMIKNC